MDEIQEPCLDCAGLNGVHYLTCPTLRLPAGFRFADDQAPETGD